MKRIFTLLLLAFSVFTLKSFAQNTTCNAGFSYTIAALSVQFAPGITTISNSNHHYWRFGDGAISSDISPTHVYPGAGVYHVTHVFYRSETGVPICVDSVMREIVLTVTPPPTTCNLVANFTWHNDSSQINKIYFVNLSTPFEAGDSIRWNFGDGSPVSYDGSPTHIYPNPGTYNVCIRVQRHTASNLAGCVKEICKTVVVQAPCNLEPKFTWTADQINRNKIYFTNQSTPATAVLHVLWTFGDGTSSDRMNPDHTYAQPGIYTVCLKIYGSTNDCTRQLCKTVEVAGVPCADISKFNFNRLTAADCLAFKFEPVNKNSAWQYHWTFGDGSSSNDMMPAHNYSHSGTYHVCLTVTRAPGCISTTCREVVTGTCFSCNSVWAKYEFFRESTMPNRIYFHALSNYAILSQSWTITRLSNVGIAPVVINQNNPIYTFNDTGYYRVCLRAVTFGQCVKEYCQVIQIGQLGGVCTLNAYPNPTHAQVSVNVQLAAPEMIHVYIYNAMNVLVKQNDKQGATGLNVVTTNIENLIPGLYNMRIVYGNHICYSRFQKY